MLQESSETITYIPKNHCINAIKQELQMVPESIIWEYIDSQISFYDWLLQHFNSQVQRDNELIWELQKSYAYLLEERNKLRTIEILQS